MKVLVLQLSDIHIRAQDDGVLERTELIARAATSVTAGLDAVLLVFSGDTAFSGSVEEYEAALQFVTDLVEHLKKATRPDLPLYLAAVPGNHDCNFSSPTEARTMVRDNVLSTSVSSVDDATITLCTEVQRHFFDFLDAIAPRADGRPSLFYQYEFSVGHESIRVSCINTAWLSMKHESPSSLFVPVDRLTLATTPVAVHIGMLHHPYNWLLPSNAREVRKLLEATVDIILTGHEHEFDRRHISGRHGQNSLFIDGAALQPPASERAPAGFNVIVLDTFVRQQAVAEFTWDGDMYRPDSDGLQWQPFQANALRDRESFVLASGMTKHLSDPGIALEHPTKGLLSLDDVFTYPDLRDMSLRKQEAASTIRGESVVERTQQIKRVVITGGDRSGKTSLAKRLFSDYRNLGYVPLLFSAANLTKASLADFPSHARALFRQQYTAPDDVAFAQMKRDKRIIIVDDYQLANIKKSQYTALAATLCDFAGIVVLLSGDIAQQLVDLLSGGSLKSGDDPFFHYRILPHGHERRNEMIERWFALDADLVLDVEAYSRQVVSTKQMADTAIGRNFLPSYPIFLLALLQARQYRQPVDLSSSTYGYFYELLIRTALAQSGSNSAFDVKLAYLAFLAYRMFKHHGKAADIPERELRLLHQEYENDHLITIDFVPLLRDLVQARILEHDDGSYRFKYQYIYSYFVASYLRDHLVHADTQEEVAKLVRHIDDDNAQNTLLFLAHLSKDPFILNQMLVAAAEAFADRAEAKLADKDALLDDLDDSFRAAIYIEQSATDSRKELFRRLDDIENGADETDSEPPSTKEDVADDFDKMTSYVRAVERGLRVVQVLGQTIKNFPGSMHGDTKVAVINACEGLGLRILQSLFELVQEERDALIATIIQKLRDVDPRLVQQDLVSRARRSVFEMLHLFAFATVKRISHSIGVPSLFPAYERAASGRQTPAGLLILASLKLDQGSAFPEDYVFDLSERFKANVLASRLLRSLVIFHFHLFDEGYKLKQRVCEELGIEYRGIQIAGSRMKLLPRRTEQ